MLRTQYFRLRVRYNSAFPGMYYAMYKYVKYHTMYAHTNYVLIVYLSYMRYST